MRFDRTGAGRAILPLIVGILAITEARALEPTITGWKFGNGAKGTSTQPEIHAQVSTMDADVLEVWYTATSVYVKANSIPSHTMGPFTGRTTYPTAANNTWILHRVPNNTAGTPATLPLAAIGVFVNGVQLFSWSDATSYESENVWYNVAPVVRPDIDSAGGHPAPPAGSGPPPGVTTKSDAHTHSWTDDPGHSHGDEKAVYMAGGAYHYHTHPPLLSQQLGDTGTQHSPILGFAFDGNPIYGPYGYANTDGTGGVRRIVSSYALRTMSDRSTLPNGTVLAANLHGPSINATYPLGTFAQDYVYTSGSGDLDVYNGRFAQTPEYPSGIYAYYTTINADGSPAFPYSVGPNSFRGTKINTNFGPTGGAATIPGTAEQYIEPAEGSDWWAIR